MEGGATPSQGAGVSLIAVTLTTTTAKGSNDQRRALHAYLSDDAHDTWHQVAADLGCSVSAMLEAMAGDFDGRDESGSRARVEAIVKKARRIDADRRRR
jgi:hypothetical protein